MVLWFSAGLFLAVRLPASLDEYGEKFIEEKHLKAQ